ncbi:MAG: hypothetical protein QNK36_12910 [Colwellia sp.]|nr:hypothetical protein [Colwellia sp.]
MPLFTLKKNIYHAVLEQTLNIQDEGIGDILPEDGPNLLSKNLLKLK